MQLVLFDNDGMMIWEHTVDPRQALEASAVIINKHSFGRAVGIAEIPDGKGTTAWNPELPSAPTAPCPNEGVVAWPKDNPPCREIGMHTHYADGSVASA